MAYEMYEIEAYFGDFFEDYEQQVSDMLEKYDWTVIEHYMDPEIAEEIHLALPCASAEYFLLVYMMVHTERYHEDFEIN